LNASPREKEEKKKKRKRKDGRQKTEFLRYCPTALSGRLRNKGKKKGEEENRGKEGLADGIFSHTVSGILRFLQIPTI